MKTEAQLLPPSAAVKEEEIDPLEGQEDARQSFHFQKIPGGLNINIFFFKNQHEASFYMNKCRNTNLKFEL